MDQHFKSKMNDLEWKREKSKHHPEAKQGLRIISKSKSINRNFKRREDASDRNEIKSSNCCVSSEYSNTKINTQKKRMKVQNQKHTRKHKSKIPQHARRKKKKGRHL